MDLIAGLVTLTALFAYVNHRFIGLPTTIGVMLVALVFSLVLVGLDALGIGHVGALASRYVGEVDFYAVVMDGMLSLLLFAGAMHVKLDDLSSQVAYRHYGEHWVVASTFLAGAGTYLVLDLVGLTIPFIYRLCSVHSFHRLTDRRARDFEVCERAQKSGSEDRGRVTVQRRCRGGGISDSRRHRDRTAGI